MLHIIIIALYAGSVTWLIMEIQNEGKTHRENLVCQGEGAYDKLTVNIIFYTFAILVSIFIDFWLIAAVAMTVSIINKRISFRAEKFQINLIMGAFLASYFFWAVWNIIDL